METYTDVAYKNSRQLTLHYSSSFGLSSKLFDSSIQKHIYAIYALVRIADEIVDTYRGINSKKLLDDLEKEVYQSVKRGYSTNPIVHAFALTSNKHGIRDDLIRPFFESMRMDLSPFPNTKKLYDSYIYGSAEVIGLMCLHVFCDGNDTQYSELSGGAKKLGSAFQKVNFLRDIASDYQERGRIYFPECNYETFTNDTKDIIIADIRQDFNQAKLTINKLPKNSQRAVHMSYVYYTKLLEILDTADVSDIKENRLRINKYKKVWLFATEYLRLRTYNGA